VLVNVFFTRASTIHRKFFHLTASLVAVSGLLYDPSFLALSAHLVLQLFIVLEVFPPHITALTEHSPIHFIQYLRSHNIWPWAGAMNEWMLIFLDAQDSTSLVLTPIYLVMGVFLPVLLNVPGSWKAVKPAHFAGVMSIGVGDSFAAIVGSTLGRHQWVHNTFLYSSYIVF